MKPHAPVTSSRTRAQRIAISALSPTTKRYAFGSAGPRPMRTFLPIKLASMRYSRSRTVDPEAAIHEGLDRVGDLELPAPGRLDRSRSLHDRGREHVHADEGEVRGGLPRLLDE